MKYTKIPLDTFNTIALNAGILLKEFDPTNPPDDATLYENLIGATSGGLTVSATPTFSDFGEDIDNCPKNTLELKHLDEWEITVSGTFVTMDAESAKFTLAAADISTDGTTVTLRNDLASDYSDFGDVWWVGDYNNGNGFIGIHISNALCTGGLSIKTTDNGKTTADFEITGHYSISDQDTVPFECFIVAEEATE